MKAVFFSVIILAVLVAVYQRSQKKSTSKDRYAVEIHSRVPVVMWDPEKPFAEYLLQRGQPVILRHTVVDLWPARALWTPHYLSQRVNRDWSVYENTNPFFDSYNDQLPMAQLNLTRRRNPYVVRDLPAAKFLKTISRASRGDRPKSFSYFSDAIEVLGEVVEDLEPMHELYHLFPKRTSVNVWIGPPDVTTPLHHDAYHNMFVQLYGRKRFLLFPPSAWEQLHVYPFLHPSHAQCQVNLSNTLPPREALPSALEAILEPGDLLYLPPNMFHEVQALSASISVNAWMDEHVDISPALYSLPLPSALTQSAAFRHATTSSSNIKGSLKKVKPAKRHEEDKAMRQIYECHAGAAVLGLLLASLNEPQRETLSSVYYGRYSLLHSAGGLPRPSRFWLNTTSAEGDHMCADFRLSQFAQAGIDVAVETDVTAFVSKATALLSQYPAETRPLFLGDYLEYLSVHVVGVVDAGWFLLAASHCFS